MAVMNSAFLKFLWKVEDEVTSLGSVQEAEKALISAETVRDHELLQVATAAPHRFERKKKF